MMNFIPFIIFFGISGQIILNELANEFNQQQIISNSGNSSIFIDKSIVNQIVDYYKGLNKGEETRTKVTDSVITLSFYLSKDGDGSAFTAETVNISTLRSSYVEGDLDNNGTMDVVTSVQREYGTSGYHNEIVLIVNEGSSYNFINATVSSKICGCENGFFYPKTIENQVIYGESICYDDSDPMCCPSLKYKSQIKMENKKLVFKSKI